MPTATSHVTDVRVGTEAAGLLLRLARAVVAATATGGSPTADLVGALPVDPPAVLVERAGAFVTLTEHGELRGCIGSLATDRTLWENVVTAAVGAAARDPRFFPIDPDELPRLSIDVSIIGQPVPLADPSAFRPGVDGVVVERGAHHGLLLPEVATDQRWGLREMLEAACWKAGLPPDAWRDPRTTVHTFTTTRIRERDQAG